MDEIGLFEAIYSARSLRRFKPDPVPDEVISRVLDAAIRAPSGSNNQNWLFVVVKDAERRRRLGEIYRKAAGVLMKLYENRPRPAHMTQKDQMRLQASATHLFEHIGEVPVLLVACLRTVEMGPPPASIPPEVRNAMRPNQRLAGSSIYPAVQNVILACRAFGLGTVLTTIHTFFEDEVRAILELPHDIHTYALLPIGYPKDKFGPVKRLQVSEVAVLDRWGNPWPGKVEAPRPEMGLDPPDGRDSV